MASLQTQSSGKKGNFIGTQGGAESFGSESFAALFEESLNRQEMKQGEVITAEVIRVDYNFVVVNAGLKSEAYIPLEEFKNDYGELDVKPGDFVSVAIESLENGYGDTILSRDKAKRLSAWMNLEKALDSAELVAGTITGKVKGGSDCDDQRHPCFPAGVAGRYASGQGHDAVRGQDDWTSRSSSSIASAITWSSRAVLWSRPAWAKSARSCWTT